MIDQAIELKKDQPRRAHGAINEFRKAEFQVIIPKSPPFRQLKWAGAERRKLGSANRFDAL